MANVDVFWWHFPDEVAGYGRFPFWLSYPGFYNAGISVTAFSVYPPDRYLQIAEVVTNSNYQDIRYLHCVVQNPGPVPVRGFRVYAGIISP